MKNRIIKDFKESKIYIENEQTKMEVDGKHHELLKETVFTCLQLENACGAFEIYILLTDDVSISKLNSQFRGVDQPTDVLSFPIIEMKNGEIISDEGDYDPDEELLLLGDIVISLEMAQKQSVRYGHCFERELAFLTAHGVFHLLGYDHTNSFDEDIMIKKQQEALEKLGLLRS